jgi:hypothetical protein
MSRGGSILVEIDLMSILPSCIKKLAYEAFFTSWCFHLRALFANAQNVTAYRRVSTKQKQKPHRRVGKRAILS